MHTNRLSDRQFGLFIAAFLMVISGIGWLFFDTVARSTVIAACLFAFVALTAPGILLPFNRLWEVFTLRLGRVVNFVLLGAFFYLLIMPFGLLIRLLGHDAMARKPDRKSETYWVPVTRHTDEDTLHDMF